jgi:hypothetical protein
VRQDYEESIFVCGLQPHFFEKKKLVMQFDREEVRVSIESRKRVERDYS